MTAIPNYATCVLQNINLVVQMELRRNANRTIV